jgi:hypothetical protein
VNAPRTWSVEVEPGWLFMDGVEVAAVAVRETRQRLNQKAGGCSGTLPGRGWSARWQQQATRDSEWADVGETARLKPGAFLYRLLAVEHLPVVRES